MDALLDRLNMPHAVEPEATPGLLASKGPLPLMRGGKPVPLMLIAPDEMQPFQPMPTAARGPQC